MIPSAKHKHLFYSEMAKLLEAGFDIRKAAAVMLDMRLPSPQAHLLKDLHRGLESGKSITAAFSKDHKAISDLERNMIGAGERGGKLAPAFQHLADYFGMLASARRQAVRSLIYPFIVLHLGIFVGSVPAAMMKGDKTGGQMIGDLLVTLLIVYASALVLFLVIRVLLKLATKNPDVDRLINFVPWVGKARRDMAMARFCKVYHSCLLAGVSMTETAHVSAEASQSGMIRSAGVRLVNVAKTGSSLGGQFMQDKAFPMTFARSYATGEEAGTLDKDLARWSKLFQDDAESAMKNLSVMLPKVLYFLILGFAAWMVLGFFNGYYESLDSIE